MVPLRRVLPVIFALAVVLSFPGWACAQFFETRSSSSVLFEGSGIAVWDFNHDGKRDIAGGLFLDGQVAVFLGNGDGTLRAPLYYTVGQEPVSVAVADFNGDGNPDLAVGNQSGQSISVLLGNGDGTFQPAQNFSVNGSPISVMTGDFNGDQFADLITNQEGSCKCASVLLGNGDGTFQPPIDTAALSGESAALGIGDFNRDGKLDAAMAAQFLSSSELTVYLGNGDGTFQIGQSYPVDSDPSGIAVADFRGIGKLDIAVADFQGGDVKILLGNGDGTFQPSAGRYLTSFSLSVATGDFNGDGKIDFVASNFGCSSGCLPGATVFLGKGDGTFRPGTFYQAGDNGWFVAVADMNNDRMPDLVLGDAGGPVVLLDTGVARFSPTTPVIFPVQLVGTTSNPLTVTLTNTGKKNLSITSLSVQGKQFHLDSSTTCATSVPAGGNCKIVTTFQPKTSGPLSGIVSVVDNASKKPQVIELSGTATVVSLSPTQLTFPPQAVGTMSQPQTVTLTNTGIATLNISKVGFYGRSSWDYSQTNTCGSQVAPGASCTFSVIFAPTSTGTRTATLSVTDDGGASPQTVSVSGTGT